VKPESKNFIPAAGIALADADLRAAILAGTMRPYLGARHLMAETTDADALRTKAREARDRALAGMKPLWQQFEEKLTANRCKVFRAADAEQARKIISDLCAERGAKLAVKSKSMVTEEIGLNHTLEERGIEVVETDLGEYVIQVAGETPSHIVAPVIHRSKESISELFQDELGMPATNDANEIMRFARDKLREKFLTADVGISGANFGVVETGGLVLVTNEGNGRMVSTLPKLHIAVIGMERIVETWDDLGTLVQLLPRSATGQRITTYVNILHGPRRDGDADGPEELAVVVVDNGRSRILTSRYAEALACIRCGACLNACPVYRRVGGHSYGWVYPGPIGAVITPLLLGIDKAPDLPYASSLCGACLDACPVKIDLPKLLTELREEGPVRRKAHLRSGILGFRIVMTSPTRYRLATWFARQVLRRRAKDGVVRRLPGPGAAWTKTRDFPAPAAKRFRDIYR